MNAPQSVERVTLDSAARDVNRVVARGSAALRTHLAPLREWLDTTGVTEISVNRPGEVWIARQGKPSMDRAAAAGLTLDVLLELARQVATFTGQEVSRERPLLSDE